MPAKRDRIIWLGQHDGKRTDRAIAAMHETLGQVREVLGPAPLLSVRIADDFNTDSTPQFIRDRMGNLPRSAADPVHRLFRGGRPDLPHQEHFNGATLNRLWATGHSEILLRPAHAYGLSEGSTKERAEAISTLAHEYGHVRENGRGFSRLGVINRFNPSEVASARNQAGATSGISEYFAVRAERTALHALHGEAEVDMRVGGMAKDMAQLIEKGSTGSDLENIARHHGSPAYNQALGYLSGTLNAHLDADKELRGADYARSPQSSVAAVSEHLPPGSKGRIFLNQTRGSYAEMRRALEDGNGLQGAYMRALSEHQKGFDMLASPSTERSRVPAKKIEALPAPRRRAGPDLEID